jgi:hypothetical protein
VVQDGAVWKTGSRAEYSTAMAKHWQANKRKRIAAMGEALAAAASHGVTRGNNAKRLYYWDLLRLVFQTQPRSFGGITRVVKHLARCLTQTDRGYGRSPGRSGFAWSDAW